MIIGILAITWISGIDYIISGYRQLRGRGDFTRADGVRLLGSFLAADLAVRGPPLHPMCRAGRSSRSSRSSSRSGGLDNLLSHHKSATLALAWGGRVLGVSILLLGALLLPSEAAPLTIVATAISVFRRVRGVLPRAELLPRRRRSATSRRRRTPAEDLVHCDAHIRQLQRLSTPSRPMIETLL